MRRALRIVGVVAGFLAVLILAGFLVPRPVEPRAPGGGIHEVVLLTSAIHTDIALPPAPAVLSRLGFLRGAGLPLDDPAIGTILVGWGGREFYTRTPRWADLTARAAFAALTVDASVLRFSLTGPIPPDFPGTRRLTLSDDALGALLDFVDATLTRGPGGAPQELRVTGYGLFDRFYEAEGRFNILIGCNVWAGAALAAAGVPSGIWTPLPRLLLASVGWHAR